MAIDLFETRTMLRPFEKNFAPKTYLMRTFFKRKRTFETESVDMDLVNGSRRMVPFVRPRKYAQTFDRTGYSTKSYTPPLVGAQFATTAEDLLKRTPGETIYGHEKSPSQRAAEQLGRDLAELSSSISRREEWMAAQAMFNGKIVMVNADEGINDEIDFGLPGTTLTGADLWTDSAATPLDDLADWASLMRKNSGYSPTMCIMGKSALKAFLAHQSVKDAMDIRRITYGQIKPEELESGVFYAGYIATVGLTIDVLGYEEWSPNDSTGALESIVPDKKILLANPAARYEMLYGAVSNAKDGVVVGPRIPFSWMEPDGSCRMVRLNSRPLPVPVDINASYRAEVTD